MNIFKKPLIHTNGSSSSQGVSGSKSPTSQSLPLLLTISPQEIRNKFDELNEVESNRIIEGLNNPTTSHWALTAAISKQNKSRNRYTNVTPWNESRVKLPVKQDSYSNYINASYVNLSTNDLKNSYIACQGPLDTTTNHFWSMSFEESEKQGNDIIIIVMVTPLIEQGMVKCDKYWPDLGEKWDFGRKNLEDGIVYDDLTIENINETYDQNEDYLVTEFLLKSGSKEKKVYHFYYYKWADAKVPPSSIPLQNLSNHIKETKQLSQNAPVPIVHCSAGVGRSGTFMVYDHLFQDKNKFKEILNDHKTKDFIYKTVYQLRTQRMMMVQTVHQFQFLYGLGKDIYNEDD
ncbi:PTP1 [Candida pseudojiufengensis]|uniref:PTP1 n=1 Tax=Candida pseudojiufengensis TaxID=497109 RepID=UPI0022252B74|nr:PTP1 [Candida pseudojiufengensis]KAI5962651.1 PTP1 [Candida pseudojiufengensis]